jgi:Cd2+/Zn2+-exporting ATPase
LTIAHLFGELFPATEHWAFLIAMLIGLIPIARRAANASTPFSIEVPTSIAAVGAVIVGATEEAG